MEDRNTPATKGDIADAVAQIDAEANHRYDDIVERIDDIKTELLKAFYGYAQGNNKRIAERMPPAA